MTTQDLDLLTTAEVHALADANSRTAPTGIRNKALVLVLAATGLRVQEVLDLVPKDVDLVAGEITVLHGAGLPGRRRGGDLAELRGWGDAMSIVPPGEFTQLPAKLEHCQCPRWGFILLPKKVENLKADSEAVLLRLLAGQARCSGSLHGSARNLELVDLVDSKAHLCEKGHGCR